MKDSHRSDEKARNEQRRLFLGLVGTAGALGLMPALGHARKQPRELNLKEADFYRKHDLAG